jgi:hypothetical protein
MAPRTIDTDYLVIGAGAVSMAFVDTLLTESDADVVMVDRRHRCGGHWNDAYPFVRLHQPSAYYGVASRELSSWTKEATGPNAGMYTSASGAEVVAPFDTVMHERFLASGRVTFLSMSEYVDETPSGHTIRSLTSGETTTITVRKKVVDGRLMGTQVPATHPPRYRVAESVACIPPNGLPSLRRPHANYTIVGAGKTAVDTCLWLLTHDVAPSRIRWIMPRDSWFLDRANFQPGIEQFETSGGALVRQFEAIAESSSVDDLLARLEARGLLMRLDVTVAPTMYHCAVVSRGEMAMLRGITDVVRMGRVQAIEHERLLLDGGSISADPDTIYIDCSASAIPSGLRTRHRTFDGNRINLVMIRLCQPLFSAAAIAWVECHVTDAGEQNTLCTQVPTPNVPTDWLTMWAATLANMRAWRQNVAFDSWLGRLRLNSAVTMLKGASRDDPRVAAGLGAIGASSQAAAAALPRLLATLQA